jgi:hypothetical protein
MHRYERRKNPVLRRRVDELIAQVRAAEEAIVARGLDAVHPGDRPVRGARSSRSIAAGRAARA